MDESKQNKAERWQARQDRVAVAQARYLGLLVVLAVSYLALLIGEAGPSPAEPSGAATGILLRLLFAAGPMAIWLTIPAIYGTMRMTSYGTLRLRALDRYVPSKFLDSPNFLDAVVFTPPPPWGRPFERWVSRLSYPFAMTVTWIEAGALLYLGHRRAYFPVPWWILVIVYALPLAWSLRCVIRLWAGRLPGERRRGGGGPRGARAKTDSPI